MQKLAPRFKLFEVGLVAQGGVADVGGPGACAEEVPSRAGGVVAALCWLQICLVDVQARLVQRSAYACKHLKGGQGLHWES